MNIWKRFSWAVLAIGLLAALTALPAMAQESGAAAGGTGLRIAPGTIAESDTTGSAVAAAEYFSESGFNAWFEKTSMGRSGLGRFLLVGGPFMWPLFLALIVALIFVIERLWALYRARVNARRLLHSVQSSLRSEGVDAAVRACERSRGPVAAILRAGLKKSTLGPQAVAKAIDTAGAIEMTVLERGLSAIAAIAVVAPMLGFLGTASGMMNAFASATEANKVNAKIVGPGLVEALSTAAVGLLIAVPAGLFHSYFSRQVDRVVAEMEEARTELVGELAKLAR